MKLLMESWRKYLKEELEAADKPRPTYSSVVLDSTSHDALMNNRQILNKIKELGFQNEACGKSSCAHHMTISLGEPVSEYDWEDGEPAELTATHLGWINEKGGARAIAVKVELPEGKNSRNDFPHITVAIPKGGEPADSNKITDWEEELEDEIPLAGNVLAGVPEEKKIKPIKPKVVQTPEEFIRTRRDEHGLSADIIRNIINKRQWASEDEKRRAFDELERLFQ